MLELGVLVALSVFGGQQPLLPRVEVAGNGMTIVRQPQTHVLVARNADGATMSTSCSATADLLQELRAPALVTAKGMSQQTLAATKITIQNADQPGLGFNDPTPAAPVGGNPGTTLGEQRLNAFRYAAQIWERAIDSPVEIQILATFAPIRNSDPCTATSGVLGAASSWAKVADFPNAPMSGVTYPIALANRFAGRDLQLGEPDIQAFFNADVDNSTCLGERNWYYGLDGENGIHADFVVVLLHELAHGLGMSGTMNVNTGVLFGGKPSIFEVHTLDLVTGQRFDQLTAAERKAAVVNGNQTVWDGTRTRDAAARLLAVSTTLRVTGAATGASAYEINPASFGPPAGLSSVAARIVAPLDAADEAGPAATDGCSAYTNPLEVAGRIALVDRGSCTFVQKALRAQEAGAIAIVVANQEPCGPSPMGGVSTDVRIPAVGINRTDGNAIRQMLTLGTADAAVSTDPSSRSGASQAGYVRLFVPCAVEPGSSMYHWDRSTTPNLLMEPNINEDLTHGLDLTVPQLLDIGWTQAGPSGRRVLRR